MRKRELMRAAASAFRVRFLGARIPVAARVQVTHRCPLRCSYCNRLEPERDLLNEQQIIDILRQLADLGCLRVSFSGGEPMLRPEIGALVDACADLGMAPEMNSCGWKLAERIDEIDRLALLKLSLDGPPAVHDAMVGRPGSHAQVMDAVAAARQRGIRTVLVCTITRENVGHLRDIVELAGREGVLAAFQPLKPYYKGATDIDHLLPDPGDMRRALSELAALSSSGYHEVLRNSAAGLEHLAEWPTYGDLRCWAGRIFCFVGADGTLFPCDRTELRMPLPTCADADLATALADLPDVECDGCGFCGALELNFALGLRWTVASTIAKLVQ